MSTTPISRPWLEPPRLVLFALHMAIAAATIALCICTGCTFPEEGTARADFYSPPHDAGHRITTDADPSISSTSRAEAGGAEGGGESSSGEGSSTGEGLEASSGETWAEGTESSSTGEGAFEPAHCDASCPEGDAIEPSDAQALGSWPGCYCATPCESDDDCGPLEACDPFFGRCTVACMGDGDCAELDDPGSMTCTVWWDDAEHFTHFCAYWNEDAP